MRHPASSYQGLRSVQIISGIGRADGGPSYSVPRLNSALRQAGVEDWVYTDEKPNEVVDPTEHTVIFKREFTRTPLLNKLHISRALVQQLKDPNDVFELIHSHGIWRFPNLYAAQAAWRRGIPHVVSPRGMLSKAAMRFSPISKRLFWVAGQRAALDRADCLHATSEAEYREFRNMNLAAPVAIIPNGLDLPPPSPEAQIAPAVEMRTLLFLGRIHPKKGIDDLVAAWASLADDFPNWRLRIVGPGEEKHLRALERLVADLGSPRLEIGSPVYMDKKWRAYRDADLFVLPTYTENFGLTVGESLACGRPVVVSKGAPWEDVVRNRCGWWIDIGREPLTNALREALATPRETLLDMGKRGAKWIRGAFAWDTIGPEMARVYAWLCGRGPRPDTVRLG